MKYNEIIICFIAALLLNIVGCATLFNSRTELSEAAAQGDIAGVQMLVSRGANINELDIDGQTALMHAICKKQTKTAATLINMGANINSQDRNGYSALSHAISFGNKELVIFLIEKGADLKMKEVHYGYSYLHRAASYDQPEISKILLKNNMDINEKNTYGDTPLHVALTYRMYDMAKLLVDCGADINARNNYGSTPLHYAVKYGQVATITKLVSESSLNRDKNAKSMITYLLSKNANTEIRDSWGYTPLSLALYYKNKDMANMLAARSKGGSKSDEDEAIYGVIKTASRYKIIKQTACLDERIRETKDFKIRYIDYSAVSPNEIGYSNTEEWNVEKAGIPKTFADSCSTLLKESGAANKTLLFIKHDEIVNDGVVVDVYVKRIILNWNHFDKKPDVYVCDINFIDSRNGQKLFSGILYITSRSPKRVSFSGGRGSIPVNPNMPGWEGTFSGRLHIAAYNMAWIVTKIIIDGK
ncbi:MAG: ankyrin repeat domain-containing protein, partial [Methanobacterium sp.]